MVLPLLYNSAVLPLLYNSAVLPLLYNSEVLPSLFVSSGYSQFRHAVSKMVECVVLNIDSGGIHILHSMLETGNSRQAVLRII